MHVIEGKSLRDFDDWPHAIGDTEFQQHLLDVVAVLGNNTVPEPAPESLVRGLAMQVERQEAPRRLVHRDNADPFRFKPVEPQDFRISMLQNHF